VASPREATGGERAVGAGVLSAGVSDQVRILCLAADDRGAVRRCSARDVAAGEATTGQGAGVCSGRGDGPSPTRDGHRHRVGRRTCAAIARFDFCCAARRTGRRPRISGRAMIAADLASSIAGLCIWSEQWCRHASNSVTANAESRQLDGSGNGTTFLQRISFVKTVGQTVR